MSRLRLKKHLKRGEVYHFSRTELGPIEETGRHDHDFWEIFWVESGQCLHWIEGEKRLIDPGTLIFVRPEDLHTVGAAEPGKETVICNLAFSGRSWRPVRKKYLGNRSGWFRGGTPERRERELSAAACDFLRRAGLEMVSAPRSNLMLERFLLNLAVALQAPEALSPNRAPDWLASAVARVEEKGLFREGPVALTRLSGRSQEHVVREAKRWLRKTPTALINEMRMRHAAAVLSTTRREIIDVCFDCGLENVGHFYTLFRKTHGMTPRRYRLSSQSIVKPG
jgi:AraC family cel operon transcriptional repressor